MDFDFRKYKMIFTADFETSTEEWGVDEARVWLWDICDSNFKHYNGTDLDSFMRKVLKAPCYSLYAFRNLAYDGAYILTWLLKNGYKHTTKDKEKMPRKSFSTVISALGQHYAYMVKNENNGTVCFMDSLKYVNMSIKRSAMCYNLPVMKGEIDYDLVREIGHTPTEEELSYIHNDTEIDMWTIKLNMEAGAIKFTQAGNARAEFKKLFSKADWNYMFPELDMGADKFCRKAYSGGFVSYNKELRGKIVTDCHSLDINSMYPAQMLHRPMPYGYPADFSGKYEQDDNYPLYVQQLTCAFRLKPKGIAMIATRRVFMNTDDLYIDSSGSTRQTLTLASPDLELFFNNYEVWDIEWLGGYKFKAMQGREITPEEASQMSLDECIEADGQGSYFYPYIKKWRYVKEHEPKHSAMRDYAKRMQNALYGALATNPERKSAIPYLDVNGILKYEVVNSTSEGSPAYLPAGIFITAWSRHFLINTIAKFREHFVYCDTDSLYLKGKEPYPDFAVHNSLYGFFKLEHLISKMKVLGSKRYIYMGREPDEEEESFTITCCGADEDIKKQITFDNFELGMVFEGKKTVKTVKGGKHIAITTYRLGKAPTQ